MGIDGARRRQKLLDSVVVYKLKTLAQLSGILPTARFNDLLNRQLGSIRICYELTGIEMQARAECPHCAFNPSVGEPAVEGRLEDIESKLDEMLENWREMLLETLKAPMFYDRRRYMSAELEPYIWQFVETGRFPENLDAFCRAVREAFADFECVEMKESEFMEEVLSWGTLSPDAFKKRMCEYIDRKVGGRDRNKVRF